MIALAFSKSEIRINGCFKAHRFLAPSRKKCFHMVFYRSLSVPTTPWVPSGLIRVTMHPTIRQQQVMTVPALQTQQLPAQDSLVCHFTLVYFHFCLRAGHN